MANINELVSGTMQQVLDETIDNDSLYNLIDKRPVVMITQAQMGKDYIDKGIYQVGDFVFNVTDFTFYECNGYGWVARGKLALKDIPTITGNISSTSTDEQGAGAKAVYNNLQLKENTANKSTTLNSSSTTTQYPASKTVYDFVTGGYATKSSIEIRSV